MAFPSRLFAAVLLLSLAACCFGDAEVVDADATAAKDARRAKKREDHWLKSILGCPLCKGKEVLACYTPCREGGKGMGECLSGCMTNNPLVLDMMLKMIPKESPPPSSSSSPELPDPEKVLNAANAALPGVRSEL